MDIDEPGPVQGLRGIDRIGLTVPDIDQATDFFTSVLGADVLYEHGPFRADDNWMAVNLGVDARAVIPRLVMIRVAGGPSIELAEYEHGDAMAERHPPVQSAVGASHIAFQVEDIDASVETLREHGVIVLGEPKRVVEGPTAGLAWVHFLAPWGQQFGAVSYPSGVAALEGLAPAAGRPGGEEPPPTAGTQGSPKTDPDDVAWTDH